MLSMEEIARAKALGVRLNLSGGLKVRTLCSTSEVLPYILIYIFILSSVDIPTSSILKVPNQCHLLAGDLAS